MLNNVKFDIKGNNNTIIIGKYCYLNNVVFYIRGNNNNVKLNENIRFNSGGNIWQENENTYLEIGNKTTIENAHLALTENNSKIIIGEDCMFSSDIDIRTGDSHSIINQIDGERINRAKDVIIKDRVWIAAHSIILKGVTIEKETVIGTGSVITKGFKEKNVIIAGNPGKIIKRNINWKRERI